MTSLLLSKKRKSESFIEKKTYFIEPIIQKKLKSAYAGRKKNMKKVENLKKFDLSSIPIENAIDYNTFV